MTTRAEDALVDVVAVAARGSVVLPEFAARPGWGLAYSGPDGRPHPCGVRRMTGPLEGLRVLDLSIALTGPYAAALLADQGAEVIKVERPGIGDIGRWVGVMVNGMSALYLMCNRGKRSIAVDVQTPTGSRSCAGSRPTPTCWSRTSGRASWTGSDSATTTSAAINPDVVYASLSGFGTTGPTAIAAPTTR